MERRGWFLVVVLASAWCWLLFLLLPNFIAVPISFTPERFISFPSGELSLRHYLRLFTDPQWLQSIRQSLIIATASTAIATVFGTLCAIGLWRLASRFGEMVRAVMLMPIIVPPIVSALAFYRLYIDLRLLDSYLGMILAHSILAVPYVVVTVSAALALFDVRLEQAARSLGAGMMETIWRVIVPSIRPGIYAGAVFAFITSWDELVVTLFITSRGIFTLPRRMWDGIREHVDPTIAAAATSLLLITFALIVVHLVRTRRRGGDPAAL
jgi:putative spermidine/putrescine transport system permease protein